MRRSNRLILVLAIAYPISAHISTIWAIPQLGISVLTALLIAISYDLTYKRKPWLRGSIALAIALFGLFALLYAKNVILFFPPIVISATLLYLFGKTLLPQRVPLITLFSREVLNETSPEIDAYTRKVTLAWTIFFATMIVECILLALFANKDTWSLFTNIVNYIFIGIFFVIELIFRRLYLKKPFSIIEFFRKIAKTNFHQLAKRTHENSNS